MPETPIPRCSDPELVDECLFPGGPWCGPKFIREGKGYVQDVICERCTAQEEWEANHG